MLELAIKAKLPLIAVTTSDRVNFVKVIEHITGQKPTKYAEDAIKANGGIQKPEQIYYGHHFKDSQDIYVTLREQMEHTQSIYIGVNFKRVPSSFFDAGEVPVPKAMVRQRVETIIGQHPKINSYLSVVGGLTLKELDEVMRLTMVRDKSLTPAGIVATRRRTSQGLQGLAQVETHNPGYLPPTELSEWLEREKLFFLAANMDPALVPKGLVLDGPAGVGKTEAAKWIAYMLGLPLYRIDLGTTKNMWVGQSEANLSAILSRLDREEPCVALFDEIEKMVSEDSSGVGASMLSQLLWWFAESPSRVLRIMTTNDLKRVPAELYRPGRIDKVMNFGGLKGEAAVLKFANHVMAQFPPKLRVPPPAMAAALKALLMIGETPVSQATVTQAVKVIVKQNAIQTKLIAAA
jgi:hypothetical protein